MLMLLCNNSRPLCHLCALPSVANVLCGFSCTRKRGSGRSCNFIHLQNSIKACFLSSQPQSRKNKSKKAFSGAVQRGKNLGFFNNWVLGNQLDWRLFYFRLPAAFVQIAGSTLQVQTQLGMMQEKFFPFVGAIPASCYMGISRALTVICAFSPCLSLLLSVSCLLNLLHNKYFHFLPWRVKWAHKKSCLSPCITTKSAHQAKIRIYFLLPSDRWWCLNETG